MKDLAGLRKSYERAALDEGASDADPLRQFRLWLDQALQAELPEPNAMTLATVGADGRPTQKGLVEVLREWGEFRVATVTRRSRHRLEKVEDRIHILEGRQLVLLNIDEVIRIIRESDEPKAALRAFYSMLACAFSHSAASRADSWRARSSAVPAPTRSRAPASARAAAASRTFRSSVL